MRTILRSAVAIALAALGCGGGPPPHIVLITADTLRPDHLSLSGHPRPTSPHLDAFAREAVWFTDAVTVIPKTAPSFATFFSGRHPREHGVRSNFAQIPPDLPLLAERLHAAGYRTAAFVANPALRESKGFGRGFERYVRVHGPDTTTGVRDAFLAFAEEPWERPTFVWIHTLDPHGPYEPPDADAAPFLEDAARQPPRRVRLAPAGVEKVMGAIPGYQQRGDGEDRAAFYVARYDGEIRAVDRALGALLDALRTHEVYDASVVVFTSDHGESLGEHDYWFEHGWLAHEPGLRIPLLLKRPHAQRGVRSDAPASNLDLLPTLLALVGLPPDPSLPGRDLLREPPDAAPELLVENSDRYPEKWLGLRGGGWKYLRATDGREQLYDLRRDPSETHDLAAEQPDRTRRLRERLRARLAALPEAPEAAPGEADDAETRERLRALGYAE